MEIPPIVPINLNTTLIIDINKIREHNVTSKSKNDTDEKSNNRRELFQKIGQQEFEDVVFTPERQLKKSCNKKMNRNENIESLPSTDHLLNSLSTDYANANDTKTIHSSLLTLSTNDDFMLKSDRNLETIQRDVENKEKLLADVLDFDLSKYMTSNKIYNNDSNISSCIDIITYINCNVHSNNTLNEKQDMHEENEFIEQSDHTGTESVEEDISYRSELKKLEDLKECRKTLLQNKLKDNLLASNNFLDTRQTSLMDHQELEAQFNGN